MPEQTTTARPTPDIQALDALLTEPLIPSATDQIPRHPATHLLPQLISQGAAKLAVALLTVVATAQITGLDGETPAGPGTGLEALTPGLVALFALAMVVLTLLGTWAAAVTSLAATARYLGRTPRLRLVLATVNRRASFLVMWTLLFALVSGVPSMLAFAAALSGFSEHATGGEIVAALILLVVGLVLGVRIAPVLTAGLTHDVDLRTALRRVRGVRHCHVGGKHLRRGLITATLAAGVFSLLVAGFQTAALSGGDLGQQVVSHALELALYPVAAAVFTTIVAQAWLRGILDPATGRARERHWGGVEAVSTPAA